MYSNMGDGFGDCDLSRHIIHVRLNMKKTGNTVKVSTSGYLQGSM